MEQSMKNRTKKFLQLLKNNAQNEAFVNLVADNLQVELQQKPWKMLRILDFIVQDLPRSNSDFTRLKINEHGLVHCILGRSQKEKDQINVSLNSEERFISSLLDHINSLQDENKKGKSLDKLLNSILALRIDNEYDVDQLITQKLGCFTLTDMIKSSKTFYQELIQDYQPLLSDLNFHDQANTNGDGGQQKKGKKDIKQMVMESIGGFKTDKIKLSDLIDESFFDDIEEATPSMSSEQRLKEFGKKSIKELFDQMRSQSSSDVLGLRKISSKRQKVSSKTSLDAAQENPKFILLSPILAVLLQFTQGLISTDWKLRQFSASILRIIISLTAKNSKTLPYFVCNYQNEEKGFTVLQSHSVSYDNLLSMILPYLFAFLMKDQFNDFEELKVITPARDEGVLLLIALQDTGSQIVFQELTFLISQLPLILKSVETDNWISRYNYFQLLKGLYYLEQVKPQLFQMFNKVLIESLLKVEDEVMILVTELIQGMLDRYLQQEAGYEQQISGLLRNLQENLKQCDEIESSSISVFNLIQRVLEKLPRSDNLEFALDFQTICPFNFHKIVNVRYSYNQIINKALKFFTFRLEDYEILFRLTLQSLMMERSPPLVSILFQNLKSLVLLFTGTQLNPLYYDQHLIPTLFAPEMLPNWLYTYHIQSFESFLFIESENFESIERDYFKIVYRPTTNEEIQNFYDGKLNNLTKSIAILMAQNDSSAHYILQILENTMKPPEGFPSDLETPVHENHFIYLLVLKNFLEISEEPQFQELNLHSYLDMNYIQEVLNVLLNKIQEEQVSIYYFKELKNLQEHLEILWNLLQKNRQDLYLQHVSYLNQLLDQCYCQHNLVNLQLIQQQLEILAQIFGTIQIQEIYECFSELTLILTSLIRYASQTTHRIKSMAAIIHLQLVQRNLLPDGLTKLLNNLIKPLLNQVKSEKVEFIQEVNCQYLVTLIGILMDKGKQRAAVQIMQVIMKGLETEGLDEIQDRGSKFFLLQMIKCQKNVFKAYNSYILNYLQTPITLENMQNWTVATLFILKLIQEILSNALELFIEESQVIADQAIQVFNCVIQSQQQHQDQESQVGQLQQLPLLIKIIFEIFPTEQIKLVSNIVKFMELKQKAAFESLIQLLDGKSNEILKFIPVFIIPVIQNIQYSRKIFNDDKQITLVLAQLLSLLPLNLIQISDFANNFNQLQSSSQNLQIDEVFSSNENLIQQNQNNKSQNNQQLFLQQLKAQAQEGFNFLQIFVNNKINSSQSEYKLEIKVKANLRDYQKQGITWIATLGHYNLNCVLCDDMGLGKTLQSLCVVLNESYKMQIKTKKRPLNLIVCPTTITHNWHSEVNKFFGGQFKSIVFEGNSSQKQSIIQYQNHYDIIIVSFEKLRNEIKSFANIDFFYLIVDEAHIIKNSKAKITQAVKQIKCEKKIALTGTPLQNKVSELWSIFDFLMPGFLEEEQIFNKKYNQYLTSNIKRLSEKLEETQAFVEALKSLKKRIQPFILRRTKDQVLKELPPKIIQDVVCEMTTFQEYTHSLVEKQFPIQQQLTQVEQSSGPQQQKAGKQILQNLILHRKVCNHPMLVSDNFKTDKNIQKHLKKKSIQELLAFENSGKLIGLYDRLLECEIIESKKSDGSNKEESKTMKDINEENGNSGGLLIDLAQTSIELEEQQQTTNKNHRALIFCQMTSFMKMITESILQRFKVPYLELLSQHNSKQRVDICNQFNADPSIRVLILTTQVGGLGLNLTGADTVIFAEHDWNPMRDLQAIDRAHRIGQTRQVCVYRLIMKGTIEEKIMGLQRFKENLAKSLVQAKGAVTEDASNLEMSDLLSSFQEHSAFKMTDNPGNENGKNPGKREMQQKYEDKLINNLDEIWQAGGNFEEM